MCGICSRGRTAERRYFGFDGDLVGELSVRDKEYIFKDTELVIGHCCILGH